MPHTIDKKSLQVIARWVALKVLVAEHNQPDNAVASKQERAAFKKDFTLPENFRIWIGKCGVGGWETAYLREVATITLPTLILPEPNNVQSVTFGIGDLFVHVLHMRDALGLYEIREGGGAMLPIYPVKDPVNWPPVKTISVDQANSVSLALDSVTKHPRVIWKPFPE
jgi:hypothetical protein